eukprot:365126-Chlamydomonas_euryale.AAC.2
MAVNRLLQKLHHMTAVSGCENWATFVPRTRPIHVPLSFHPLVHQVDRCVNNDGCPSRHSSESLMAAPSGQAASMFWPLYST